MISGIIRSVVCHMALTALPVRYGSMVLCFLGFLFLPPEYLFLLILLPFMALLATILLPVLPVSKAPFLPFPRLL